MVKIRDHSVALCDFRARDFVVMARIAQLLCERRLSWCWCARLREDSPGGVGSAAYADPVGEETESDEQEDSGGVQYPDMTPGGFTRGRENTMGEIRKGAGVPNAVRRGLLFVRQAIK